MKISELVKELDIYKANYGDIDVVLPQSATGSDGEDLEWIAKITIVELYFDDVTGKYAVSIL